MGQVTIYIEDEVEKKMLLAVQSSGLSKSKWVSKVIKDKVASEWPNSVKEMAGSWSTFPSNEELSAEIGVDMKREDF